MVSSRVVEYVFFFGLLGIVAYIVWQILAPFVSALALAAIIVTICYPMYRRIVHHMPRQNEALGALVTTLVVLVIVIIPFLFITQSLIREAVAVYNLLSVDQLALTERLDTLESTVASYVPNFQIDFTQFLQQGAQFAQSRLGSFFAGTASTLFLFFIAMIGTFYFFKDGRQFTKNLVVISPLPDDQDEKILARLAIAIRSVATGVVLIALIQGSLTALGLWFLGFDRYVLWGTIAAFGALIPGVGTSVVLIPAIIFLAVTGAYIKMIVLIIWGMLAVGLIDNLLGPYLLSRGNKIHPFSMLISVLGGIAYFGPIGFIVGPVMLSLLLVLLELYNTHINYPNHE